jgi:3D-(3,5/4)-trihydroxycyclohexane-1,2-dione acylhydrolase (decyclizing)
VVDRAFHLGHQPLPSQTEVIGAVNEIAGPRDVVVQAAGSLPGDLQMRWRSRDPKQYHVEHGVYGPVLMEARSGSRSSGPGGI